MGLNRHSGAMPGLAEDGPPLRPGKPGAPFLIDQRNVFFEEFSPWHDIDGACLATSFEIHASPADGARVNSPREFNGRPW